MPSGMIIYRREASLKKKKKALGRPSMQTLKSISLDSNKWTTYTHSQNIESYSILSE